MIHAFKHSKLIAFAALLTAALLLISGCSCSQKTSAGAYRDTVQLFHATAVPEQPAGPTPEPTPDPNSYFEVHFIDVGQGDSALILCDGEAMMIDGGEPGESDVVFSYLKSTLPEYDISGLKYIVASHPDSDHVGGLSGALNYLIKNDLCDSLQGVYCSYPANYLDADAGEDGVQDRTSEESSASGYSDAFLNYVKYAGKAGQEIQVPETGDTLPLGSATVQFIQPPIDYGDTNDDCLVIMVTYRETSFLFTGDIPISVENDLIDYAAENGIDLHADVLKVGHHGSKTSTGNAFLDAVDPTCAVISVGKDNGYGHPTAETLERLQSHGIALFRTDLQGHIIFRVDMDGSISYSVTKDPDADVWAAPGSSESDDSSTVTPDAA